MTPACRTEGTVGGGGCPPPVSPQCPGHAGARNAPTWTSVFPPGHYTPNLGRDLVLPFPGKSSERSWDCHSCLPCFPSTLPPLLPHRTGFGGVKPVTPLLNPSHIPDIVPVPVASPGISAPLPSSGFCRPRLPGPRSPGMVGIPYPQFFGRLSTVPPG